jgi:anion-transporting  ArsA/GET3 family ATPase
LFQGLPNFLVYLAPTLKQLLGERLWPWIQNSLTPNRSKAGSDLSSDALRLSKISRTSQDSENKAVLDMLRELDEKMENEEEEMEEDDEKQIEADADEEPYHNGASHAHDLVEMGFRATDGTQKKSEMDRCGCGVGIEDQ